MDTNSQSSHPLESLRQLALRIYERHQRDTLPEKLDLLRQQLSAETGMAFRPLYDPTQWPITCAVMGSGSFTTGRQELLESRWLRQQLGWSPVEYVAVITDRQGSNAANVAAEFDLPPICVDYGQWREDNQVRGRTKLFGFTRRPPPREKLEQRLAVRKRFDAAIHQAVVDTLGIFPNSISLRGYDFVLTDALVSESTEVDNTHPASLIVREEDGSPAYAGWQESATQKMADDGHTVFVASLARISTIASVDDLQSVDAGELLATSQGAPQYDKQQDHFVLALKALGLLPMFWSLSEAMGPVAYMLRDGRPLELVQRRVAVGRHIRSGANVVHTLDDLTALAEQLEAV